MKKRAFAFLIIALFSHATNIASPVINKEEKDNVLQLLWATGGIFSTAAVYKAQSRATQTLAAAGAALCWYQWFKKTEERAQYYNYENISSFLLDDTLSKMMSVWHKLQFRVVFK